MFDFKRRDAFTLIELLVVISIIALLMAMLMPALSRTKELAAEAVCMSNLKQWGVGYAMYYSENDYRFPRNGWIWIPSKGEDDSMSYGFDKFTTFSDGIKKTYKWFCEENKS